MIYEKLRWSFRINSLAMGCTSRKFSQCPFSTFCPKVVDCRSLKRFTNQRHCLNITTGPRMSEKRLTSSGGVLQGSKELVKLSHPYLLLGNDNLIFQVKDELNTAFKLVLLLSFVIYIEDVTVLSSTNLTLLTSNSYCIYLVVVVRNEWTSTKAVADGIAFDPLS